MRSVPRLKDVARHAGVSTALVSSYLNTPHLVGERSRSKIQEAIDELQFMPNAAAQQLRRGVSRMVPFIAFDISDPLFVEVARGAQRRAAEAGLHLVLADTNGTQELEASYLQLFREQRVRGLLLAPVGDTDLGEQSLRGVPMVLIDHAAPDGGSFSVSVNDLLGGQLAVEHLLKIGRRRIAVVGGPDRLRQVSDRIRGARAAVEALGCGALEIIATQERRLVDGRIVGHMLANRTATRRPDAVFCINDLLATGMVEGLVSGGLDVPRDIAVIGYNDTAIEASGLSLSSIRQPHEVFGSVAIELLLEQLEHSKSAPTNPRQVVFDPELIVRSSTVG